LCACTPSTARSQKEERQQLTPFIKFYLLARSKIAQHQQRIYSTSIAPTAAPRPTTLRTPPTSPVPTTFRLEAPLEGCPPPPPPPFDAVELGLKLPDVVVAVVVVVVRFAALPPTPEVLRVAKPTAGGLLRNTE
jgi:hypothetical protein